MSSADVHTSDDNSESFLSSFGPFVMRYFCLPCCMQTVALPAVAHWGTCPPLDFQRFMFCRLTLEPHKVWHGLCAVASPNIFVFCDSRSYMNLVRCIILRRFVYNKNFHVVLCPLLVPGPGDATACRQRRMNVTVILYTCLIHLGPHEWMPNAFSAWHHRSVLNILDSLLANQIPAKGVVTIVCQIEIRKMAEC